MSSAGSDNEFRVTRTLRFLASDPFILVVIALVLFAVLAFDIMTPLGAPVWILYFIPLTLTYWSGRRHVIPIVCLTTVLFISAGFFFSPPGVQVSDALINRAFFSLVFIGYSVIFLMIRP